MSHNTLENYYQVVFAMAQHHKYSIGDIENMIPFERDIYVQLLKNYLEELEQQKRQLNG